MNSRIRKELEEKGYADTRKYRYQIFDGISHRAIKRIERVKLDTAAAYGGWETIEITKRGEVIK